MAGFLIHSPLSAYAESMPDHPALSCNGETLSYRELDERSNQLAHALLADGVTLEDRVGIFLFKGLDLGVAIYGILKAGCAFVPLDPTMPVDRLALIIDDCGINSLVSSDALIDTLRALPETTAPLHVIGVDSELPFKQSSWQAISKQAVTAPDVVMIDQQLGYIMYTSGSTGIPKGMMHTHAGSICYAEWGRNHVGLRSDDKVASHAPLHFDLSIFDFFSTLRAGGTVVLVPEAVTRFPASWTGYIESEQISVVFTVPYTLITMVDQGAIEKRDLSSLRWLLFGGEPYAPRQLRQLMHALPGVKLTNVYGPAEAPSCTCYDVPDPMPPGEEPLPIGIVSRNSDDLIVDENGDDCEEGASGELCIRSSTLTRGYWNRPDLNARAFLLRESHGHFPHVYFRTGDRVVRHADGMLRFLGRMDRMVKTRGHRVELDEVEFVLLSLDGVEEGAAYAVVDDTKNLVIMADVLLKHNSDLTEPKLFDHMQKKLPRYAVPQSIHIAESLPHTSSGKIDRKTLAEQRQRDIDTP
ncbi:MAG: amino acid adenylation domain-containing protein [Pseudomonadota bacterium]